MIGSVRLMPFCGLIKRHAAECAQGWGPRAGDAVLWPNQRHAAECAQGWRLSVAEGDNMGMDLLWLMLFHSKSRQEVGFGQ